jgi:hypothetical protein
MDSSARLPLVIGVVIGLVLGLLLGMALFWWLFPVEWTDAHTYDLVPEERAAYMALVADSFLLHRDPAQANEYLSTWTLEEKQQALADARAMYDREGQYDKAQAVNDLALALAIPEGDLEPSLEPTAEAEPPEVEEEAAVAEPGPPEPAGGIWDQLRLPCLVFVLVLLLLVVALIGIRVVLQRRTTVVAPSAEATPAPQRYRPSRQATGDRIPLGRFRTTYHLGEDTYDESFSIEAPTGEFLGECGMGISEVIHDGQPDKVMAFEVWLFDKSDIRTVTKVLMSEYAYYDEALRVKLAPKGEAVLAQPGAPIVLETSGLQVSANVTEMEYGGGDLPQNSYFSRLVVELMATAKGTDAPGHAGVQTDTAAS